MQDDVPKDLFLELAVMKEPAGPEEIQLFRRPAPGAAADAGMDGVYL